MPRLPIKKRPKKFAILHRECLYCSKKFTTRNPYKRLCRPCKDHPRYESE